MLLSHIKRLCTLLPTLIAATPQPTSASLPSALVRAVPACAQPCIKSALFNTFPLACTAQPDLHCLCSSYNIGGESLGEVALGCVYASCSTIDSGAVTAYNVCLGQKDAVMPTQSVLTVSPASTITSRRKTSSHSTVSSTSRTTSRTSAFTSTSLAGTGVSTKSETTPTNSVIIDSISTTTSTLREPSSSAVPLPASTPNASTAQAPPTMKPAQIAGLSVAAAATFILAIGLMVLSVCLRKRRERKSEVEMTPEEKAAHSPPPRNFSTRLSRQFIGKSVQPSPSRNNFAFDPRPPLQRGGVKLAPAPSFNLNTSNPRIRVLRTVPVRPSSPDHSSIHPALRPGAGYTNNSGSSSVPSEQIGLAITAELPGSSVPTIRLPRPLRSSSRELKEDRVKSLLSPTDAYRRPDSVLTQDTVFEEDIPSQRRRSSKLLPTPPVPIPPIRTFQHSRPAPAHMLGTQPRMQYPTRQQSLQESGLSLDIPVRHSRSQPMQIAASQVRLRRSPTSTVASNSFGDPGSPVRTSSAYDQHKSFSTSASTLEPRHGDIPDYYFMTHKSPPKSPPRYQEPKASPSRIVRPKESPKVVGVKTKPSPSTVSRATSRASTNIRDSVSSQTSFETVDANDPTPEDDDDDKQLEDSRLSPVAESPISNLRYPKVPRSSNQLVPRSPRSPASQHSNRSPVGAPDASPLRMKRRGEPAAVNLERQFAMRERGSPSKEDLRTHMHAFRQHMRSTSVESAWNPTPTSSNGHARAQSGQWPKSPAMYETDFVRPLNIRAKSGLQPPEVDVEGLKSPLWVPRLTPRKEGDDLFISVSYSKGGRSEHGSFQTPSDVHGMKF
ncbi:hypothetical protein EJ04DRAFT_511362 [Polyplosphaeria fusca]|uniref:CFEM domain-containing protein n=1 Tax=Polyplosphaeria fusca TaxID=682080 RepID=A0A9P4R313_9PLEO|nr:hypothetical protein EJ04DRAFT_511362 [Polyplosphaeria fusca]